MEKLHKWQLNLKENKLDVIRDLRNKVSEKQSMIENRLDNLRQSRASELFLSKVDLDEKHMNRSATFDRLKKDRMKYNKYLNEDFNEKSEIASDIKSSILKTANDSRYRQWAQAGQRSTMSQDFQGFVKNGTSKKRMSVSTMATSKV
jgi:hypothetical protein